MKIRNIIQCFLPSVKGGYCVLFLFFFTASLFSQSPNWEIGIGLRPLTLKEEPYSFIAKKFIVQNIALRMGFSSLFDIKNKEYSYSYIYQDTANHSYSYNYTRKDKFFLIDCFGGLQIGKRYRNAYLYEATDFSFEYKWESINPYPIRYNSENMRPNEIAQIAILKNNKTLTMGIKQSLGFQYFITSYFSLSVEGGLILDWDRVNNQDGFISISSYDGHFPFGGSGGFDKIITWNFQGKISPLTFLFLNYHF